MGSPNLNNQRNQRNDIKKTNYNYTDVFFCLYFKNNKSTNF